MICINNEILKRYIQEHVNKKIKFILMTNKGLSIQFEDNSFININDNRNKITIDRFMTCSENLLDFNNAKFLSAEWDDLSKRFFVY